MNRTPHLIPIPVLLMALMAVMAVACGREKRLYPFRWESTTPAADSATLALDRGLFTGADPDTLASLVAVLERETARNPRLGGRTDFFRAAVMEREGHEESADSILRHLSQTTDSASSPYLFNRLRHRTEPDEVSAKAYFSILARRDYFRSVSDPFMTAAASISLGNLLKACRDADGALTLYAEADSLLRSAGFGELAVPIGINRAHAMLLQRDTTAGTSLLRDMLRDPVIAGDVQLRYMVLSNLFTSVGDTVAADSLVALLDREGYGAESDATLTAFLSEREFDRGNIREALRLARVARSVAVEDADRDIEAIAWQRFADASHALGQSDSAYIALARSSSMIDSLELVREPEEMRATETARIIKSMRMEKELAHGRRLLWLVSVLFVVFLCVAVAAAVVVWRINSLRLGRAREAVEREKAHRRLMATLILLEEKDALLRNLRKDISHLEVSGEISSVTGGQITTPIKTHIVRNSDRDTFIKTFSELHPDFSERLMSRAKDLTETDIRLARFIVVGLDNKQIASTLGIRPESVKQARWRLRSKLGLPSGASLESELNSILD